mmetsp:Transcript_11201/g.28376  ORF Transcript_11201/g.28376 Transcript_11201/m.28376 type:complete len:285 (-) Transcript_11201:654-1508(-)
MWRGLEHTVGHDLTHLPDLVRHAVLGISHPHHVPLTRPHIQAAVFRVGVVDLGLVAVGEHGAGEASERAVVQVPATPVAHLVVLPRAALGQRLVLRRREVVQEARLGRERVLDRTLDAAHPQVLLRRQPELLPHQVVAHLGQDLAVLDDQRAKRHEGRPQLGNALRGPDVRPAVGWVRLELLLRHLQLIVHRVGVEGPLEGVGDAALERLLAVRPADAVGGLRVLQLLELRLLQVGEAVGEREEVLPGLREPLDAPHGDDAKPLPAERLVEPLQGRAKAGRVRL